MINFKRMSEIARLRKGVYTEQVNVRIDPELKVRLRKLKEECLIDTGEEARKALCEMVAKLEHAVRKGA
jgi:ribosomal protein S20